MPGVNQVPPQSKEAEQSVLGSMLRENVVIGDVMQIIRAEHFYLDAHQKICQAIISLYDRGGPVDAVMLAEELKDRKQIEEVGGYAYLGELWGAVPTAANVEYYARIVRDKSILRRLIQAGNQIARDAQDQTGPAQELLEQAEREIFAIGEDRLVGETVDIQTMITAAYDRIDERMKQARDGVCARGIPTGLVELDSLTSGLQDSELIYVAARTSIGKTAFAISITRHVAVDLGLPVFFVTLEQSTQELSERLLCCQGLVDSYKLRSGLPSSDEYTRILKAGSALMTSPQKYFDSPNATMQQIAAAARRSKLRDGTRLMVVDYLGFIESDNRKATPYERVSGISRRLKPLARELQIPLMVLVQLNRGPEGRSNPRPRLSDLRDSGSLEQDADVVMLLYRIKESGDDDSYSDTEEIGVIVEKNRNGPRGEVKLTFRKQFMRFENYRPPIDEPLYTRNGATTNGQQARA